jgi:hypothetical protein
MRNLANITAKRIFNDTVFVLCIPQGRVCVFGAHVVILVDAYIFGDAAKLAF